MVFLTSFADAETLDRAKEAEPFGYLVKPFRRVSLCSAIEMALHKHQSEQKVIQREAWLKTVLQSAADPTIVTDVSGCIQFFNLSAEQLLGWTLCEVAGAKWTEVMPLWEESSGQKADDLVTLAILHLTTLKIPSGVALQKRDGSLVAVEGQVSASGLTSGTADAVITIRDVSRRNHEEAKVRHEQKMLAIGRLAGGVAHDFNNLLTVIIGNGHQLAEGLCDRPQDHACLEAMLEAAKTGGEIAQQLLALSGKQFLATNLLSVNECLNRTVRLIGSSLGPKICLATTFEMEAGQIRMNAAQFDQVFLNILLNARDAMPNGGKILISTSNLDRIESTSSAELTDRFVRIMINDSGHGMSQDVQEHIFEPFFTTKDHGQGTGLGLAIVYGIVKDAGGEISVRSKPGDGTCFEVLLPRVEQSNPRTMNGAPKPFIDGSLPKTILLVEDQAVLRGLIHNYFEQKGFNLLAAENGQQALDLADSYEGRIDVLVSDVLMPKMDGPTLSHHLAASRPDMKVLFMSGYPGERIECLRQAGLTSTFMQKPFSLSNLLQRVHELTALTVN